MNTNTDIERKAIKKRRKRLRYKWNKVRSRVLAGEVVTFQGCTHRLEWIDDEMCIVSEPVETGMGYNFTVVERMSDYE